MEVSLLTTGSVTKDGLWEGPFQPSAIRETVKRKGEKAATAVCCQVKFSTICAIFS